MSEVGLDALLVQLRRMTPMPPDPSLNPTIVRAFSDLVSKIARLKPPDPRAIEPLLRALGPGEGRGAYEKAIAFIESFAPEVQAPALLALIESGPTPARRWSATLLGRLGWQAAEPALKVAVEDGDPTVRAAADLSLRMLAAARPDEPEDEGYDPLFDGIAKL